MKKKKYYLLFLLLISMFLVNNVTAVAAQANGKTEGEIGFIDGGKEAPREPEKPIDPDNPKKESSGLLPKTGEEFLMYLTIIGMISLAVTAIVVIKRKNNQGCS
ncbi:LPXTG cell wall anchor domain-containing protein [Enterococcus sp. DIV0212c]|uniref:LPXTG cell wall anchor domain-containing protein n=1 Tax=Enterococcus sp. DIV0212c TaxID=2230867 RepID=UPI001F61D53F|nr:LPXTG cell wall anchor domain-containing protein [Enterococcus sp. DIV0212c]